MLKVLKKLLPVTMVGILASCSQVLQMVDIDIDTVDRISQEEFKVVEKTLTLLEANSKSAEPYIRKIVQTGIGEKARVIPETKAVESNFPQFESPFEYKVGIGDTLLFTKLIENISSQNELLATLPPSEKNEPYILGIGDQISLIQVDEQNSNSLNIGNGIRGSSNEGNIRALAALENLSNEKDVIQTTGRIGSDGSVLLLEVGRLEALGKTINELRSEVRNILIRNGISPKFQLEISSFNSQKAYLTVNSNNYNEQATSLTMGTGGVIQLTDQPLTLREALSTSGVTVRPGTVTKVRLQRSNEMFSFDLSEIYKTGARALTIKDRDHIFVDEGVSNVLRTEVMVGSDGNIILPDIGKINVLGKSIKEIESEILNFNAQQTKYWKDFQLQLIGFGSQRVVINVPKLHDETVNSSKVITLNNTNMRLDELLTQNGVTLQENKLTKIYLQRDNQQSSFLLSDLLLDPTKIIYVKADDRIRVERLTYKKSKVFIIGSGLEPEIFSISPENRETLADALFTKNGALASNSAKRSDIYLLRGNDPVTAFHLDALSPSRLLVAEAMELRPNDIIFVSEQPIVSFNRTLQTLFPLRILLRDIDNQNIP